MDTRVSLTTTAVLLAMSQSASAGGFYISEIGTPGSLGTAGAANPTNNVTADAAWTNPAAMMGIKEDHGLAGDHPAEQIRFLDRFRGRR